MKDLMVKAQIGKQDLKKNFEKGMDYDKYRAELERITELVKQGNAPDMEHPEYMAINQQRMNRIEKTFILWEPLRKSLEDLHHEINWIILSEVWCGDSAQNIPALMKIAEAAGGKLNIRMLMRDENPELMNAFLTNGSRSVPKLIQCDSNFNVTGIWGPRPTEAQELVKRMKSDPETAPRYSEELHKWYAQNKSFALQTEVKRLVDRAAQLCPDCMG